MHVTQVDWHGARTWALVSASGTVLRTFRDQGSAQRNLARRLARGHVVGADRTHKRAAKPCGTAGTPTLQAGTYGWACHVHGPKGERTIPGHVGRIPEWRRSGRILGLIG